VKRIGIAIWDGVEELDFAGPYEVLTAWAGLDGHAEVVTIADNADSVRCAHGLRVLPDRTWDDIDGLDVLLVPGGNAGTQIENGAFVDRVRALADSGTLMTSVCTGALVYAQAGLLDGRPATTHWSAIESLPEYGTDIEVRPDDRYVDDGNVITAAGVSAGIDMALHLITRLDSVESARRIRRYIQYDPAPPV
jgi:transcriptional regulator GlxA family with amidase domain